MPHSVHYLNPSLHVTLSLHTCEYMGNTCKYMHISYERWTKSGQHLDGLPDVVYIINTWMDACIPCINFCANPR